MKKLKKGYELKQLLISLSIVLALIAFVIVCLFTFMFYRNKAMSEDIMETLSRITYKYTGLFEMHNTEKVEAISSITSHIRPDDSLDKIVDYLSGMNSKCNYIKMGYVNHDFNGVAVDISGNSEELVNVAYLNFIEDVFKENTSVAKLFIEEDTQTGAIFYAVPVYHQDKIMGALFVVDNLSKFKDIVKRLNSFDESTVLIVDRSGKIIIDASGEETYGELIQDLYDIDANFFEVKEIETRERYATSHRMHANKELYFMSHAIDENETWYALSVITLSEFRTPLKSVTIFTLCLLLFITTLFICMIVYMLRVIQKSRERMNGIAFYNSVTGVINENGFMEELPELHLNKRLYSFVVLDIHNFKFINYSFGYQVGNKLLGHITEVLKEEIGEDESFYHKESDKFGILLHTQERVKIAKRVEEIMNKISDFELLPNQRYPINCHCGIILLDTFSYDTDINLMIDRAYIAKKRIKDLHGNQYAFYDEIMYKEAEKKNDIEKRMKSAINNNEFKLYIQPKYDLVNEGICSGEVLVRWVSNEGKVTLPADFIPIFEQDGFILELDLYMLEEACRFQSTMRKKGVKIVPLSINQSRILLFEENYIQNVNKLLKKYELEPGDIIIEITESISDGTINELKKIISRLHELGIKVSIDDFGSGYSSLNILKELTIDELKLDKCFLSNIKDAKKCEIIIESIITMAKKCHIQVVCEGVETKEHVEMLRERQCDIAQGYYYSKPISETEFQAKMYGICEA